MSGTSGFRDEEPRGELLDDGPPPGRGRRLLGGVAVAVAAVGLLTWHQLSASPHPPRTPAAVQTHPPSPSTGATHAPSGATVAPPDALLLPTPLPTDLPPLRAPLLLARHVTAGTRAMAMSDSWLVMAGSGSGRPRRGHLTVLALPGGATREVGRVTFAAGGGDACPRVLLNRWVAWSEVADQPAGNQLSPGPPVAWRLHVRDLLTGDESVLDHGVRDATADDVCVHDLSGTAVWQRPDGSWRLWLPWSAVPPEPVLGNGLTGVQVGTAAGVLYVRDHDEVDSDLVWSTGSGSRLVPVATVPHLSDVAVDGERLVWSSGVPGNVSTAGSVRACRLPDCSSELQLADETAWRVVAGRDVAAWSSGASGSVVTARTFDGRYLDLRGEVLEESRTLAMSANRLAVIVRSGAGPLLRVYDLTGLS